jgi:hypothetical protein
MTAIVIVSLIVIAAVASVRFGRDSRPSYNDRQDWHRR